MKIAPIDIAHKSFHKKAFGLDGEEVTDFLRSVADEMETLIRERNKLRDEVREKEMQILDYRERDKVLRETITTAQRMAEKMREDAERESKMILNDANQRADMIVKDARDSLKRVYQEVSDIKRARIQLEANLRALLQSHLNLIDTHDDLVKGLGEKPVNSGVGATAANAPAGANTSVRVSPLSSN